jgi:DNA-binding NtrC family response regulator
MKTILLVENELENRQSLDLINRSEFRVITIQDGLSALSAIRAGVPVDLVITDYHLNGKDNWEFLAGLKKIAPAIPAVILTAHGSIESYLRANSHGVFEYLHKPIERKELGKILHAALEAAQPVEYSDCTLRCA